MFWFGLGFWVFFKAKIGFTPLLGNAMGKHVWGGSGQVVTWAARLWEQCGEFFFAP